MELIEDWDRILRRAWSVKFSAAATIFGVGEVLVSILGTTGIPNGLSAGVGVMMSVGAVVARALAQPEESREIAKAVVEEMDHGKAKD